MNAIFRVALTLTLAAILTACGKPRGDLLVGEWSLSSLQNPAPGLFYPKAAHFYKEGSFAMVGDMQFFKNMQVAGTYKIIDDSSIRFDSQLDSTVAQFEVSDSALRITFPGNAVADYIRH